MDRPGEAATHYQVLSISAALIDAQHDPSTILKRAYHRALLQNHPDKAAPGSNTQASHSQPLYSIDQITTAFNVLSSPRQRAEYDSAVRLAAGRESKTGGGNGGGDFQTGIENVDLDDLDFDETLQRWYRSCRCGNDRGYDLGEDDLAEVGDEGELMVGCLGCSLWLRVHFAVVDEEDEEPADSFRHKQE